MQKEIEFECRNFKRLESDKCIFHDSNFLDDENKREIIRERFEKEVEDYLSDTKNEPLFCIGYRLYDVEIIDKEFPKSVYFTKAVISGSLIINSKFLSNVSFLHAKFYGQNEISFADSKFSGPGIVDFSNAKFLGIGDISFSHAEFSETSVDFSHTLFSKGDVSFSNAKFLGIGDISFSHAEFYGQNEISFADSKFSGPGNVDFSNAKFYGKGDLDFIDTEFSGQGSICFDGTRFSKEGAISFTGVHFSNEGDVSFSLAKFYGKGDVFFSDVQFSGKGFADFSFCEFSEEGNVDFSGAMFSKEGYVTFSGVRFSKKGNVSFVGANFFGQTFFNKCTFATNVDFKGVIFKSPIEVRFDTEDLSNVSFLDTDITRIIFAENTRFGVVKVKINTLFGGKVKPEDEEFMILDERIFEKCIDEDESKTILNLLKENLSLGSVLASYRNLRENYEYRLRYDEAGKCFIREMELKRNYRDKFSKNLEKYVPVRNSVIRRNFSFIGLYRRICKYGESANSPLIIFGAILFLSTSFWYVSATYFLPERYVFTEECKRSQFACSIESAFKNCHERRLLCSLERTFSDIVGFPDNGIIIDYATRITSIIVLATLFLPLRRQFERRFRH